MLDTTTSSILTALTPQAVACIREHTRVVTKVFRASYPGLTFRTGISTELATFPLYYKHRGTARHSQGPAGSQYTAGHKISPQ